MGLAALLDRRAVRAVVPGPRPRGRSRLTAAIVAALFAWPVAAPEPSSALGLGFNDASLQYFSGAFGGAYDPSVLAAALSNSRSAGSTIQRFSLFWNDTVDTSASAPTPAQAVDPGWAGYRWESTDRMVSAIASAGLEPLPVVTKAPSWAEGPDRPPISAAVPRGTWRPSPVALEAFATALARRYNGTYPDPSVPGRTLPRISTFQAWNEPNLFVELGPQWEQVDGRTVPSSAPQYRRLLNAFYAGVKRAQPSATVLGAGTAPFGDLKPGGARIPPALFYRQLLCVDIARKMPKVRRDCPAISLDGWAHHPYPAGPPTRRAANPDDVTVPDLAKLTTLVNAAARAGVIGKAAASNLWITEISWESQPDPSGLPLPTHAQYMEASFFLLWKAGARNVLWWNSRDDRQGSDWEATLQSGIFARGASALDPATDVRKPAWTAFRFPFTAYRTGGGATLWARGPGRGRIHVEARGPRGWKRVATLRARGGHVATSRLRVGLGVELRAIQGDQVSLVWRTS